MLTDCGENWTPLGRIASDRYNTMRQSLSDRPSRQPPASCPSMEAGKSFVEGGKKTLSSSVRRQTRATTMWVVTRAHSIARLAGTRQGPDSADSKHHFLRLGRSTPGTVAQSRRTGANEDERPRGAGTYNLYANADLRRPGLLQGGPGDV
ncbi:uncharacterized protein FIBRA_06454 [Fibroporia radiculosa]|uniref:Uncharacterized protein n=1 Tax=Fibroporia radiculosa TaxID=599839 RepID=J4GBI8_9APHY|nr:uncharacterized protein FIBRA_06454 [Fibroporia radiculosa]CCM04283.1 predicted protein [Fibroporia radiculosa]